MTEPLLRAEHLHKRFANGVVAVDDVSLTVRPGETVGVVGESGCGKSTTAKLILRLVEADAGTVHFDGQDLRALRRRDLRRARARLQLVPQHPQSSLNPRMRAVTSVAFNLRVHGTPAADARRRAYELLERVGIGSAGAQRFPHELSGGQLQRVAIARALATEPSLLVCDEPVSALDKSVQAQVLNLLADLQRESGLAYLFISHDLSVVEHFADRVVVMYLGRVVEHAPAPALWARPRHPYSAALLAAAPGRGGGGPALSGEIPDPTDPPSGCVLRNRCPSATERCAAQRPELEVVGDDHATACWHRDELDRTPAAVHGLAPVSVPVHVAVAVASQTPTPGGTP